MNRKYLSLLYLVVLCLFSIREVSASDLLRGTVTDPTGAVITGASIQLLINDRPAAEVKTGPRGDFSLAIPAAGPYTLLAAASGFAPALRTITPPFNGPLELTLELAPYRQSIEIETALPATDSLLDMTGLRESPARDLGEALSSLDGVFKIRKAGIANDLVIRGFQQNNINVLIDGARIYGACPSHMDPPAQHVDFAEVDHVEVTKGAFDVTHQGSLGAVVNIITRSPALGFRVNPSLSLGSFGYWNPALNASWGTRTVRIAGGYSYRVQDPYKDGSGRRLTDYNSYSALGKSRRAFDVNTGWFEAQFSLSDQRQLSFGYTRQQAGLILYPYLQMDSDYDNADRGTIRYSSPHLRADAYFTQVRHFMSDSQRTSAMMGNWMMAADAATRTIGGRIEADWGRHFTLGLESYNRNWNVLGTMKMGGMMTTTASVPDVNTQTLGAYLTYHHSLTDRLRLTGGLRFDHAQSHIQSDRATTNLYYQFHNTRRTSAADNYPSGNARLTYSLPASMELFAGLGTTGRIPDAEERYISRGMGAGATVGNPLLPITRNTEVAAGWSLNRTRLYLRPNFFYSVLNNFILVNNQIARTYSNVDARIYGGETTWGLTVTPALSLTGGGSYSRGTVTPQPSINIRSTNLPEMPPLRAWSSLRWIHRWAFAELGAVAVNRQSHVSADLKELPTAGYALLNPKIGATWRKVSASFSIDNLLNRYYYEHLSYYRDPFNAGVKVPEPGRSIFLQLRYTL